jgi:hypothetical protein
VYINNDALIKKSASTLINYSECQKEYQQTDKFKDLQARAIQIVIQKQPIEIAFIKKGAVVFMEDIKRDDRVEQSRFIRDVCKYCISNLTQDELMIFKKSWKNNFLTKNLKRFHLKKYIYKINSKKFLLDDIKVSNYTLKKVSIMLLDRYNLEDISNVYVASTSMYLAKMLHRTTLLETKQIEFIGKFGSLLSQIADKDLSKGNDKLRHQLSFKLSKLYDDIKYYTKEKSCEDIYIYLLNHFLDQTKREFLDK